jgi:hypothetical protein
MGEEGRQTDNGVKLLCYQSSPLPNFHRHPIGSLQDRIAETDALEVRWRP